MIGRLGDQGSINQKYDVAISTACGSLDFIVVQTVKDAEACMNFLRVNRIGRSTFIALDKMNAHQQARERNFNCPADAERLFDLITPKDNNLLNAFYFAVKDCLVAKDIKSATNIAFNSPQGKFRVVSLQGEIVELSGVMSGGG